MSLYRRDAGIWKNAQNQYSRQSGVWKNINGGYIRDAGIWKPYLQHTLPALFCKLNVDTRTSTYLTDVTGNGRNFSLTGTPTYSTGKNGTNCIDFNGSNGLFNSNFAFNPRTENITIVGWWKFNNVSQAVQSMYRTHGDGLEISLNYNKLRITTLASGGGVIVQSSKIQSANVWTFIALVWDVNAHIIKLYTAQVGESSPTLVASAAPNGLINELTYPSFYIVLDWAEQVYGHLDDIRIYKNVLTQPQLDYLYHV